MSNSARLACCLIGLSCILFTGCLPVAWINPPMKVELGGAGRAHPKTQSLEAAGTFRASVQPMQAFSSRFARHADLGAGYTLQPGASGAFLHGPFAELGWVYTASDLTGSLEDPHQGGYSIPRFGVSLRPTLLFSSRSPEMGWGGTVQGTVEWTGFSNRPFTTCASDEETTRPNSDEVVSSSAFCGTGAAQGEHAVGFYVEYSRGWMEDERLWSAGAGLTLRLPASMGVGFVVWDD